MLHEKDPDVLVTVRKLVMVSLMEVFKDIVPGYHLRQPTEREQKQKVKKLNKRTAEFAFISSLLYEPHREKTGLRGFRPGPTQTALYSHR